MAERTPKTGRILIVDDQEANVVLLERMLRGDGYAEVHSTTDPTQVFDFFRDIHPDLLLLDLHMPVLDGFDVLDRLAATDRDLPVLVLSADITPDAKRRALSMGARDFVSKPFDHLEVLLRVENLLDAHRLRVDLKRHNDTLEQQVRERTADLERTRLEILHRLALAGEYRDDATQEHARRLGRTATLLARRIGLSRDVVEHIGLAATLHDIGKIGVPDAILLKPGRLTPEEFHAMKRHSTIGAQLLSGSSAPLLSMAEEIAATHHERWDGTGYPRGLAGEAIPIAGRLVALADVFDVLTHERPYKSAWPLDEALDEIRSQAGRHFDPRVVGAFEALDHRALLEPVGDQWTWAAEGRDEAAPRDPLGPRSVLDTVQRMLAQAGRTVTPTAAVLLELDGGGRPGNGRPDADEALEAIDTSVRAALRQSDFAARCDEGRLLLVLPNTDRRGAQAVVDKLAEAIAAGQTSETEDPPTVSYGMAAVPEDAGDAFGLLRSAAQALSDRSSRLRVAAGDVDRR